MALKSVKTALAFWMLAILCNCRGLLKDPDPLYTSPSSEKTNSNELIVLTREFIVRYYMYKPVTMIRRLPREN